MTSHVLRRMGYREWPIVKLWNIAAIAYFDIFLDTSRKISDCRSRYWITQPTFDHNTDDYKSLRFTTGWTISCLTKKRRSHARPPLRPMPRLWKSNSLRLETDKVSSNIYPTRCNVTQFIYTWKLPYIFRVVLPPIIRNAYKCIYSIWYATGSSNRGIFPQE